MGRKKKNAVHSFFSYEKTTDMSMCLVTGCFLQIKGQHARNLLYHLSSKHEEEFKIVKRRNELANENDEDDSSTTSPSPAETSKRARSQIEKLKRECLNLVTVHGRPFALLDDLAFKNILAFTGIPKRELQSFNGHNIRNALITAAKEKREQISLELKNKLVCIKVDGATCQDRMFLGINAQIIKEGQLVIKHLSVTELYARSTSEHLVEVLLRVLREYRMSVDQIFAITVDNGSNMIKMVSLLNDQLSSDDTDDEEDVVPSGREIDEMEIRMGAEEFGNEHTITSVRCAAHTLQLAVKDAMSENEIVPLIEEARQLVRRLRTPTMKNILKAGNKRKPILDCTTRWHSTLDMLERLLELRDCCSETHGSALYMCNTTWQALCDCIKSLTPAKVLTKQLQSEQLTIGDFFYFWTKCYIDTSKVMVPLAQEICRHMEMRKVQLMQNKAFLSALFLDPRFEVVLSAEETATTVNHIGATWLQILKVESRSIIEDNDEPQHRHNQDASSAEQPEEQDEMEQLLAETEIHKRQGQQSYYVASHANILGILDNFSRHPRVNHKENILQFWQKKKISDPQLFKLSEIILATPATQVSVERLFSSLKFVLSHLRYNLTDEIVQDILVLRNNLLITL